MGSDSVERGVREAFDFWLSQHDISTPEIIEAAVRAAVDKWLEQNGDELMDRIAKSSRIIATLPQPEETPSE